MCEIDLAVRLQYSLKFISFGYTSLAMKTVETGCEIFYSSETIKISIFIICTRM